MTSASSGDNENALDSFRINRELDSNERNESNSQLDKKTQKKDEQKILTICGITMNWSDEFEKASDSILTNFELNSNETDERDSQYEQQLKPKNFHTAWKKT
jgi:hypothetical protein